MSEHANKPVHEETEPRYDKSRVHVTGVLWFALGFVLTTAGLVALVWWIEQGMERHAPMATPAKLPLNQPLQPSPQHPTLPWEDLAAMRQGQLERLHSYGELDGGKAHVPIERAMDLLLQSRELNRTWNAAAGTQPARTETQPVRVKPSVENRS